MGKEADMANAAQALMAELDQEAAATRRVLERVPADRLTWKPHAKSMTLGQLAGHVASIPGGISQIASLDGLDVETVDFEPAQPGSAAELLPMLEENLARARAFLTGLDEASSMSTWRLKHGEEEIFAIPRIAVLRTLLLNHWYHHRGQLVVYLRILDLPVPAVYGRSADENAFAAVAAR
jgi:uncharacterized damage-inducible protein DinB